MRKPFSTMFTLEGFFARVNSLVLLQMMLKFEGLSASAALELSEIWAVIVVGHVSLKLRQVGELLRAHRARL